MLARIRERVGEALWKRSVRRDLSRFGWRTSPSYTAYYRRCQAEFAARAASIKFPDVNAQFREKQFASAVTPGSTKLLTSMATRIRTEMSAGRDPFVAGGASFAGDGWSRHPELEELFRTDLGDFIRSVFCSEFKIAAGWLNYKKGGVAEPKLWHSDSGPGTRLNVFVYLSEGRLENAPTAILPWAQSEEIFIRERQWLKTRFAGSPKADKKATMRALADYYESEINARFPEKVETPSGPTGLMVAFNNNTLHTASTPQAGHDRMVAIFTVYPAPKAPDFARIARNGLPVKAGAISADADV
jgi:hypothetical protein